MSKSTLSANIGTAILTGGRRTTAEAVRGLMNAVVAESYNMQDPTAGTLTGTELLPLIQGGVSSQVDLTTLASFIGSGGGNTLAAVLLSGNKTNEQAISSNNGKSLLNVLDAGFDLSYTNGSILQELFLNDTNVGLNFSNGVQSGSIAMANPSTYIGHSLLIQLDAPAVELSQKLLQSPDTYSYLYLGGSGNQTTLSYQNGVIVSQLNQADTGTSLGWANISKSASINLLAASTTISHTDKIIFSSAAYNFSGLSASTFVYLNSSKNLVSLSNAAGFLKNNGSGTFTYDNTSYLSTSTAASTYLALAGGTMAGNLILNADATTALGAVTLQQLIASEAGFTQLQQGYDASTNLFPTAANTSPLVATIKKGMVWYITVAGTLGGTAVTPGDVVTALVDSPGTTASNWVITEHDLGFTPVSNVLNSGNIFVGNGSNVAAGVAFSLNASGGAFSLANTGVLTMPNADTSTRGLLLATDWNTFNGKTTLATVNAQNLSVFAATTSAQLAGVLSDETGYSTGAFAVFSKSPSIDAPTFTTSATFSAMTAGSIFFADTAGLMTQDNSNFYWNKGSHILNVNTGGDQTGTDSINTYKQTDSYTANNSDNGFTVSHSRGTGATPSQSLDGDYIGLFGFYPHDGTTWNEYASMRAYVHGSTSTNRGADLKLYTKKDGGALTLALTLDNAQNATFAGTISTPSIAINGTAGNGFVTFLTQSSQPTYGASGFAFYANASGRLAWRRQSDTFERAIGGTLTADRLYTIPDASGTLMIGANNLSEVTTPSTARANIGTGVGISYMTSLGIVQLSPAASTTYYFGSKLANSLDTTVNRNHMYFPRAGTINNVYVYVNVGSGSSNTSSIYLRLNNTTDYLITNALTTNASAVFSSSSVGVPISAGDSVEVKWVTPAWATPPTNMFMSVQFTLD